MYGDNKILVEKSTVVETSTVIGQKDDIFDQKAQIFRHNGDSPLYGGIFRVMFWKVRGCQKLICPHCWTVDMRKVHVGVPPS